MNIIEKLEGHWKHKTINRILFFLLFVSFQSCQKIGREGIESFTNHKVVKTFNNIFHGNYERKLQKAGLSIKSSAALKDFSRDDLDLIVVKIASEKNLSIVLNNNPELALPFLYFSKQNFDLNSKQLRWINRELLSSKCQITENGEVFNSSGKLLFMFKNNKIKAVPGDGKSLNSFLNIHPLIPECEIIVNKTIFRTDNFGRVKYMKEPLISEGRRFERNGIEQGLSKKVKDGIPMKDSEGNIITVKAGYPDYLDDGGHLLANSFGGISEQINYLPMNRSVNRNKIKAIEDHIRKNVNQGAKVTDFILIPRFKSKSNRPESFKISYYVNGELFTYKIYNN